MLNDKLLNVNVDFQSTLLTLDIVQTSLTLFSLNRNVNCYRYFIGSKNVSGFSGLNTSLQYITVTRSSVWERLMMLWV